MGRSARDIAAVATPACLAVTASGGQWRPARHLLALDRLVVDFIQANRAGRAAARILVVDAPPRHGKSEYISHYLPAWFRGVYPDSHVLLASYEWELAAQWGAKARDVFATPLDPDGRRLVGHLFGGLFVDPGARAAHRWRLAGRAGSMQCAGAGGPLTGKGAHLLIIDDPFKNDEQALSPRVRANKWNWFLSTALTRLEPTGCLIVVATRWHREDISGKLLAAAAAGDFEPVAHAHLPAIAGDVLDQYPDLLHRDPNQALWPERFPLDHLLRIRRSQSRYWWLAMYQGLPASSEIVEWPDSYFGDFIWCDEEDWPTDFQLRLLAVDPSKSPVDRVGDPSAIVFAGVKSGLIYVDASIQQRPIGRIIADSLSFMDRYHPDHTGFEANAFQELLADQFATATEGHFGVGQSIFKITNNVAKILRIRRLDPYLRNRRLRFRRTPGCRILVEQLRDFPLAEHDDGPDALEMALRIPIELQHR